MLVIKRKQVVVISMAVLIAAAGYLNYSYNKSGEQDVEEISADKPIGAVTLVDNSLNEDFMEQARLDREISRSKAIETLQGIADDEQGAEASRQAAEMEAISMAKLTESETRIESLIKAKGFEDAVIYISDGKVSAIIKSQELDGAGVAKIVDIISEQTGITAENIKVITSP
ncbi:MAG: SpoIIIAH-like family protein [Clostridia bacterium]|nr:SpoIIIAH-like family protein [Clostridia bacterium]